MIEYQAAMTRPDHLTASNLSAQEVDILLDAIASIADPVTVAVLWRPAARDPDDDMVIEAAVNGMADAIVTFSLCDFTEGAARFGIEVMTPGAAWRRLEAAR